MRFEEPWGLSALRLFDSTLWQTSPHLQRHQLLPWFRLNVMMKGSNRAGVRVSTAVGMAAAGRAELQGHGDVGTKGQEGAGG